jgi:hypothetical protein
LTKAYAEVFVSYLEAAGIEYDVLDLSGPPQSLFDRSVARPRELYRSWGAVVVFDYFRRTLPSPVVRLPHGIRPNREWNLSRSLLMRTSSKPRYAAVGLPDAASVALLRTIAPEYPADSVFVAGCLRADLLLSEMKPPTPGLLGVFSGWKEGSFLPSVGEASVGLLEHWMASNGYDRALVTVHPRVRLDPSWPATERALLRRTNISLVDAWETEFASCSAFFGDRFTSLFDVLALTGRPVHEVQCASGSIEIHDPSEARAMVEPGWTIGSAGQACVEAVQRVLSTREPRTTRD